MGRLRTSVRFLGLEKGETTILQNLLFRRRHQQSGETRARPGGAGERVLGCLYRSPSRTPENSANEHIAPEDNLGGPFGL